MVNESLSCELMLTSQCNMDCTYCIARDMESSTMTQQVGEKAIDLFVSMSCGAKYIEFIFTGGEPTLEFKTLKHLIKHIEKVTSSSEVKTSYVLKTNGTMLSDDNIKFLGRNNFNVVVSIDGDATMHNEFRKSNTIASTHNIITTNIKKIIDMGVSCTASYSIHPEHTSSLVENVEYLCGLGITNIDIGPLYGTVRWDKECISAFLCSLEGLAFFIAKQRGIGVFLEIAPLNKDSEHINDMLSDSCGCGAALTKLAFLPSGKISGCSSLAMLANKYPNLIIGDIYTGINDEALENLQQECQADLDKRKQCQNCETFLNCSGGCTAINYAVNEKPFEIPEFYCETISSIPNFWKIAWNNKNRC